MVWQEGNRSFIVLIFHNYISFSLEVCVICFISTGAAITLTKVELLKAFSL